MIREGAYPPSLSRIVSSWARAVPTGSAWTARR